MTVMNNLKLLILTLFLCMPLQASSQFYDSFVKHRPQGLNWQQLNTDHFRIIYPDGEDSLAYRTGAILENQYPLASKLTGGLLENFPVVLDNYNDLSNGFVTSLNFRSEVVLAPFKGKGMNPRTGDWLEGVLSHELVHAAHVNVQLPQEERKFSFSGLLSYVSPDAARSIHSFVPVGLHEGLAVYHESNAVSTGGGRGNYTYFNNRFNSNFTSSKQWNMGQTFIPSDYTLPYNRHYLSGYHFMDWLQDTYGEETARNSIRFHYYYFFMGYGFSLYHTTGKWPWELYDEYITQLKKEEKDRKSLIENNTTSKSTVIDIPFKGELLRSPKWISEQKLLTYGNFYNGDVGFYSYNLEDHSFRLIRESFTVDSYNYEIAPSKDEMLYSSYKKDPLYPGVFKSKIYQLDINTGEQTAVSEQQRIYNPTSNGNRILALQTKGASARIVEIEDSGQLSVIKEFMNATPVALKFNPVNPAQIAVIVNRRGTQALWIASSETLSEDLDNQPTVAFKNASVFDPEWHPSGKQLLFSVDAEPAMNVYELDLQNDTIAQLTNSRYNAFEASYAPDGNRIAYVLQQGDEQKLAVLDRRHFSQKVLSGNQLMTTEEVREAFSKPLLGAALLTDNNWTKSDYKSDLSWLKPRIVFPVIRENSNEIQTGVLISSSDVLTSQGYYAEITGIQNRLWYNLSYNNKTFYPGFKLSAYSDPDFFVLTDPGADQGFGVMREERGFELNVPFNYTFKGDTRLSSVSVSSGIGLEQHKYYDLQPDALSDYSNRLTAEWSAQLNLGILNRRRDIQPSSGFGLFGLIDKTLNTPKTQLRYPSGAIRDITLSDQWAVYYGVFGYLSPLRELNQSLRLDVQFLQQSKSPVYSTNTIVPMGFSENPFPSFVDNDVNNSLARISSRYTVPLFYPDTGGLTVPLYLSSIYLTGFSHTLTSLDANNLIDASRSIFGAGFHIQFKVSNLMFDFGVGIAFEPSRNETQLIIGQF